MKWLKKKIKRFCLQLSKKSRVFKWIFRSLFSFYKTRQYRGYAKKYKVDDKTMIFTAFQGRRYACSPRAIYERLLQDPAYDDYTFVWAFRRPKKVKKGFPSLERAVVIRYNSRANLQYFATAKYWISNLRILPEIAKKPEQIYVQTWHGSPFKRLGYDLEVKTKNALYTNKEFEKIYTNDALKFDFLVTQSPFCSEKMSSGFNLPGCNRTHTILETGYPRNDFLINHTIVDVRRMRKKLKIPSDKKVILYAPTWRDDQHTVGLGFTYAIGDEFDYLYEHLREDYVILFRAHYFIANAFDFEKYEGFVINVSKMHEVNYLYIISDMLITDYSSVFFDYANLNRPILFYMYDRKNYAENLRGFWLSFDELPGPVVEDIQSLVQNIRNIDTIAEEYKQRHMDFNLRCNALDDGHASERVIEAFTGRAPQRRESYSTGIIAFCFSFERLTGENVLMLKKARELGRFLIVFLPPEDFEDQKLIFERLRGVNLVLPESSPAEMAVTVAEYKTNTMVLDERRKNDPLCAALEKVCKVLYTDSLFEDELTAYEENDDENNNDENDDDENDDD